jgi:hypothetical protein
MAGRRRVALFALLASLVLLAIFLLRYLDLDLMLRWSDRVAVLPTAQAQYRLILDKIASATNDDLLLDDAKQEPRLYRENVGCIAAQGVRTYGTNRAHADILADYTKVFTPMGWEYEGTEYFTKTTSVQIVFVDPISPDYSTLGNSRYQTLYRVSIVYADPQIYGCFG